MRVLLDACVWGPAREALAGGGHDVASCSDMPEDPGDEALIRLAWEESRVLVTLDKDFGELAIVRGLPHAGIVRLVGVAAREQGVVGSQVLARYGDELARGAIVTVEPGRVRVRPAEPDAD